MSERLQKLLSAYGLTSRREAEAWIAQGRVTVNGQVAVLGTKADPTEDRILVDGMPLEPKPEPLYLMLHKPRGFVTTLRDEKGDRTVADLVADCGQRVYPVGRLDKYSEGLLLLTNDGNVAQALTHPSHQVEKVYRTWVSQWTSSALEKLRRPIVLEEATVQAVRVRLLQENAATALLEITIREGRNRQIRRMCQAAGLTVTRLCRIREGKLELGSLPTGTWRILTQEEIAYLHTL